MVAPPRQGENARTRHNSTVAAYRLETSPVGNIDELELDWLDLQLRSDCSYFQSWGWICNWLETQAGDLEAVVTRVWHDDRLVGMGLFLHRDIRRRGVFRSRALFLNEYPFDGRNMAIEYNGVLADTGHRDNVYHEIICHLFGADPSLDEIFLGAVDTEKVPGDVLAGLTCTGERPRMQELESSFTWAVDLEAAGPDIDSFLKTLSKNRRAQVRRSMRLYGEDGPLRVEVAGNEDTALEYLDGLRELHTARWERAGGHGVFANPRWVDFHTALVRSRFSASEIQLLRVRNDATVIGYLYNLVWDGHVHVLQTGFSEPDRKGLMPGYVVHVMAIGHCMAAGKRFYDLMHGDELYKRIMCKEFRRLAWMVLQRPRLRFSVERGLLEIKRSIYPARRSWQRSRS